MDSKDLETIERIFSALSKAKWDNLDGNSIIEIHGAFVALRKLEEKIKQQVNTPVDKVKKNASK